MKKENKNSSQESKSTKKEMVKFLYNTKNIAKKNYKIPYDLRVENYSSKSNVIYTYGIR